MKFLKTNKIAIVTPYGGEPRFDNYSEFILAKGLIKLGFEVRFYTYKMRDNPRYRHNTVYQGVKIFRCRQRLGFAPGLFLSIIRFQPNVVVMFHPRSFLNFSAFCAAKTIKAKIISEIVGILHDPYIVSDTDDPINNFKKDINLVTSWGKFFKSFDWINFIFHMPIAQADIIIAINKDEQKYAKQFYKRNSEVIYWAAPPNRNLKLKKPESITLPDKYLLFIGQIKKRKGWDTAIEALGVLKKQNILKNLVFVTPHKDLSKVQQFIKRLNIEKQVIFLSNVSNEEKNWLYVNAEYLLTPSRYEGFPLPGFECFIAKRPVLATNIPVFLEFLEHKKNAMISKVGSAENMAENIKILDNNPELVNELINGGIQTLLKFDAKAMIDQYIKLFF